MKNDTLTELTHDERILILDALAMAFENCHWTGGSKEAAYWSLYQKLAPVFIKEEECDT